MLRHIVMWNYKDGFSIEQNMENAKKVKQELEQLKQHIDEVVELNVYINELSSSNRDIILDSLFEDKDALEVYRVHPEHKRVGVLVAEVLQNRACIDYYTE